MSFEDRPAKDVLTSVTARATRARAELHRSKLRGDEELRKGQKEAESRKHKEELRLERERMMLQESLKALQGAGRMPRYLSDSSLSMKNPQVPKVDSGSPRVSRDRDVEGLLHKQKEDQLEMPRRLRNTLEGDLHIASRKGADARWDRIQKEKMKKWSSLDVDILQSSGDLRRMAFTPPLRRSHTQKHAHTRSQSPFPLRRIGETASADSSPKLSTRSSSMGNLPSIGGQSPSPFRPDSTAQRRVFADVHLPPILDKI